MKVYLLCDKPLYEGLDVVDVYLSKEKAEEAKAELERVRKEYLDEQNRLDSIGDEDNAWLSSSPHCYDDLYIEEREVKE